VDQLLQVSDQAITDVLALSFSSLANGPDALTRESLQFLLAALEQSGVFKPSMAKASAAKDQLSKSWDASRTQLLQLQGLLRRVRRHELYQKHVKDVALNQYYALGKALLRVWAETKSGSSSSSSSSFSSNGASAAGSTDAELSALLRVIEQLVAIIRKS
jgi:hypothetical protein